MALKGIHAYKKGNLKQELASADPHKITLMLMQGALERMAYAKGAIERKEYENKSEHISRAVAICLNLRDTLDMSIKSEISDNLFALYDYMVQRLTDANIQNSLSILDEVINLMLPIKNAWAQIPDSAKQEAYAAQREKRQAAV
ncbi:flagellar export chaperone FliS [Paraneptunicella aestuarii]|uniref:flagellar export chaperone FliS n=1 Tax=Paraneptunicella aestuarii TaxID=2831148 RepID=UPI001E460405|nr:flagellar export chaperone FliS [Paraneptunicella aestuarii]UAA39492.1 flagellar export chaperone FliS [Paraneptunicella aestuarii]